MRILGVILVLAACGRGGGRGGDGDIDGGGGGAIDGGGGQVGDVVVIEPGTFTMGSPDGELGRDPGDEIQHDVTISTSFILETHEVTQMDWRARFGNNPSMSPGCDDCPVDSVSWWDALAYANARSAVDGQAECYTLTGCTGSPGDGLVCTGVTVNATAGNPLACEGYRLPTESEWEYAYRAGTATAFHNGGISATGCAADANLDAIGWYCGNAGGATHPVAQKTPNAWGLYDMSGNLYDWCWDWYGPYPGTTADPTGAEAGTVRVLRGGSWESEAEYSRAAFRHAFDPNVAGPHFGIRLARSEP